MLSLGLLNFKKVTFWFTQLKGFQGLHQPGLLGFLPSLWHDFHVWVVFWLHMSIIDSSRPIFHSVKPGGGRSLLSRNPKAPVDQTQVFCPVLTQEHSIPSCRVRSQLFFWCQYPWNLGNWKEEWGGCQDQHPGVLIKKRGMKLKAKTTKIHYYEELLL